MEVPDSQVNLTLEDTQSSDAPIPLAPGLYVVATPIGNLRDITLRALDVLRGAAVIACEDTRMTKRLLDRYGITTPTTRYDDHSGERERGGLITRLTQGEAIALVSDAGTPLVSDPGFKLVRAALAAGHNVVPIPGPSSILAGLSAAGLPSDQFFFGGFLPEKQAARQTALTRHMARGETVIVFEAARRLPACLADIAAIDGTRDITVARELTKRFEEIARGTAADLAAQYQKDGPPRGEVVLLLGPAPRTDSADDEVDAALREALKTLSVKEAATALAYATGRKRRDLYNRAVALSKEGGV